MTSIGPYTIHHVVGMGATSAVYLGEHADELFAVKQLGDHLCADPQVRARFAAEPRVLAELDHPSVLRLHAQDMDADLPWFATEFCAGGSLADQVIGGHIRDEHILLVVLEALDALDYLHGLGIVHRDIKPENLLLDEVGAVRICDFGIAHSPLHALTIRGDRLGTPSFMAPEQMESPLLATPRSDLFALGATLFCCLARSSALPLIIQGRRRAALDRVPEDVRDIVDRATRLDPDDRYQTATEMADELAALVG